jgi:hypothetical protein
VYILKKQIEDKPFAIVRNVLWKRGIVDAIEKHFGVENVKFTLNDPPEINETFFFDCMAFESQTGAMLIFRIEITKLLCY